MAIQRPQTPENMQAAQPGHIQYYPSYEEREAALEISVGHLIPCRHHGPRRFWQDFKKIAARPVPVGVRENIAYISADPRDSLAFGSPLQVLAAACMPDGRFEPGQLAAEMEIDSLLDQPLRTLSGGEAVKLALAKARAISGQTSKLVMSSPFSWLSRSNHHFFERVLDDYQRLQIPVEILALAGEDNLATIQAAAFWLDDLAKPVFNLHFSDARIGLGSPINAVTGEQLWARVVNFSQELISPCLLEGGNGQGKSLLAKSLAGAVETRGVVRVHSDRTTGRARLLFQDAITQTMLRSFAGLAASANISLRERALQLYRQIIRDQTGVAARQASATDNDAASRAHDQRTLLEIKTILIAVRLAEKPPALILDEPDWGLSRSAAIGLMASVVQAAHAMAVPVILISHKPWWQAIAGSRLKVDKSQPAGGGPFEIRLQVEADI